mgnify:CR=1 FL=1
MLRTKAGWRPVVQMHTQAQAVPFEHFLDFSERLLAEIRRTQKFDLCPLDEIANVHNVLGLQAVRRPYGQFELIHRTQQDRIDLVFGSSTYALILTLQVDEDG